MKEEILKLGIEEKVVDELLKIIGKNIVPKNQFNEVNEVKKQLAIRWFKLQQYNMEKQRKATKRNAKNNYSWSNNR